MRTYYIVQHHDNDDKIYWQAHKRGFVSTFNSFNLINSVYDTLSYLSVKDCENKLRNILFPKPDKVVKTIKM